MDLVTANKDITGGTVSFLSLLSALSEAYMREIQVMRAHALVSMVFRSQEIACKTQN